MNYHDTLKADDQYTLVVNEHISASVGECGGIASNLCSFPFQSTYQ